jgi:hypothetical protein
MTLSTDIRDNESKKFRDTSNGPAVAVVIESGAESQSLIDQIMKASDREKEFTWLDFGLRSERINTIKYSASSVSTQSVLSTFSYSQVGNNYRLDAETRALI